MTLRDDTEDENRAAQGGPLGPDYSGSGRGYKLVDRTG
jgi:hypothetical protein